LATALPTNRHAMIKLEPGLAETNRQPRRCSRLVFNKGDPKMSNQNQPGQPNQNPAQKPGQQQQGGGHKPGQQQQDPNRQDQKPNKDKDR
jgi:hypothetical protein